MEVSGQLHEPAVLPLGERDPGIRDMVVMRKVSPPVAN
jgi:hypothetical protein